MSLRKVWIGIDPGKQGAIVAIDELRLVRKFTTPLLGKRVDTHAFNKLLLDLKTNYDQVLVVVEDVHAIFGSAAGATFSFGHSCGIIEGLVVANNLPYVMVQPKIWQKVAFEGIPEQRKPSSNVVKKDGTSYIKQGSLDTKTMSIMASKRLYPEIDLRPTERSKNDSDGISDALMMAHYGIVTSK